MGRCAKCTRTRGGCPHTSLLSAEAQKRAEAAALRKRRGTVEFSNTRKKGRR